MGTQRDSTAAAGTNENRGALIKLLSKAAAACSAYNIEYYSVVCAICEVETGKSSSLRFVGQENPHC